MEKELDLYAYNESSFDIVTVLKFQKYQEMVIRVFENRLDGWSFRYSPNK